jgi:hypothetical protein
MAIYAKNLSCEWRKAFSEYERISGFEPMFQDEIDAGDITPQKAWCENLKFLENIVSEVSHVSIPETE